MKKSRFTESQIRKTLKEHEAGKSPDDICRELGINRNTLYNWTKKYSGMKRRCFVDIKNWSEKI
jgi:putative transposase